MSFINKIVIITGAGSGIGEAIAIHFANLSARLSLIDINADKLSKVADQCENLSKTKVFKVVADVGREVELKNAVDLTILEYGKIDVVINCAGITGDTGMFDPNLMNLFDDVINVNVRSVVAMTHYTAAALKETKGCIINISSVMASVVCRGSISYKVSKAGVTHFTKIAALELADMGVRVNCISPGPVKTNIFIHGGKSQEESEIYWEELAKSVPLKHVIKPEEIAELAAYLASDKAKSITGSDFVIDCGLTLAPTINISKN